MLKSSWQQWTSDCLLALELTPNQDEQAYLAEAQQIIKAVTQRVEVSCNRFEASSEMSRINAAGAGTYTVSQTLAEVLAVALEAYKLTGGAFDPRVEPALVALGYGTLQYGSQMPLALTLHLQEQVELRWTRPNLGGELRP